MMLRSLALVFCLAGVCCGQDDLGERFDRHSQTLALDSIARSMEGISDAIRDRRESEDAASYYQYVALLMRNQLHNAMRQGNDALAGWRNAENAKVRLQKECDKKDLELASLRRKLQESEKSLDRAIKQRDAVMHFAELTTDTYAKALLENKPELITKHILTYWRASLTEEQRKSEKDPKVEVKITK